MKQQQQENTENLKSKIIEILKRKKSFDKFSIAYMIGCMESQNLKHLYSEVYKKEQILDEFFRLAEQPEKLNRLRKLKTFENENI